jgi:hypothetical protein
MKTAARDVNGTAEMVVSCLRTHGHEKKPGSKSPA